MLYTKYEYKNGDWVYRGDNYNTEVIELTTDHITIESEDLIFGEKDGIKYKFVGRLSLSDKINSNIAKLKKEKEEIKKQIADLNERIEDINSQIIDCENWLSEIKYLDGER